jgi:hypothetical protein
MNTKTLLSLYFVLFTVFAIAQQREQPGAYSHGSAQPGQNRTVQPVQQQVQDYSVQPSYQQPVNQRQDYSRHEQQVNSGVSLQPEPAAAVSPERNYPKRGSGFILSQATLSQDQADIKPLSRDTAKANPLQVYGAYKPPKKQSITSAVTHPVLLPGLLFRGKFRAVNLAEAYGVQIGYYTDLHLCKQDARRHRDFYKTPVYVLMDPRDQAGHYRLVMGRFDHIVLATLLRDRLMADFPHCFVVNYEKTGIFL